MPLENPSATPQSGVSKAYDFKDVDANLHSKAQDLQAIEKQIITIVAAELGIAPEFSIQYPESFDTDSFADKVSQVADLERIGFASETGKKISMKRLTNSITQNEEERAEINKEIDDYIEPAATPSTPITNVQ